MSRDQENQPLDEEILEHTHSGQPAGEPRGAGGGLLIALGTILLLAGTAMIVLPSASPQHAWIVRSLAERGVTSFPVFAAGVLVCGLWLTVRTSRAHSFAAQEAAGSARPALESLAEEIVHLRDGLQGLRIEFVYLKDAVQTQADRGSSKAASSDSQADAMYRLAASLDQLGQRVDEHLDANQREIREILDGLATALQMARLEGRGERLLLGEGSTLESSNRHAPGVHGHCDDPDGAPTVERRGAEEPDLDSWQRDPSDAHGPVADRERLGVLDLLDDLGRLLPRNSAPDYGRREISADAFEGVRDEGWDHPDSLTAPLPARRSGGEIETGSIGGLLAGGRDDVPEESTIVRKLEELRALLGDARVRDALASLERTRD